MKQYFLFFWVNVEVQKLLFEMLKIIESLRDKVITLCRYKVFFKNVPTPASFRFKQTIQFLQQINVKNVHPVYGAGIRTHGLLNTSSHP